MGTRRVFEDLRATVSKSYAYQPSNSLIATSIEDRSYDFPLVFGNEYYIETVKLQREQSGAKTFYCRAFAGNSTYLPSDEEYEHQETVSPLGNYPFCVRESSYPDEDDPTTYVPGLSSGSVLFEPTQSYNPDSSYWRLRQARQYVGGPSTNEAIAYSESSEQTPLRGRAVIFKIVVPASPVQTGEISTSSWRRDDWGDAGYDQILDDEAVFHRYIGSDDVDPTQVKYSRRFAHAGRKITVYITPSNGKVYGGTVVYWIEYSIDGGQSWRSAGETEDTSIILDIPDPPQDCTFQVRVRAVDRLGYYGEWVYGDVIPLMHLIAYFGVNGVAKTVDRFYVGINGKAKSVKKAYIGVDDTATRFL